MSRIAAGENGQVANELLHEFYSGYPIEKLRRLLHSDNESAVQTGAFIASELGERFAPFLEEVKTMLAHPMASVRFDALDVVLVNATRDHAAILAQAVMLVHDSDDAVRWKALDFLSKASRDQLEAVAAHLGEPHLAALVMWLARSDDDIAGEGVIARLSDSDRLTRVFATVAAARVSSHSLSPLERALGSPDDDLRSFAKDKLHVLEAET